jgi:hypothetical protein
MTGNTICICSDIRTVLLALSSHTVSSRLVLQCRNSLQGLSFQNRVKLFWVPGHCGIIGNEEADAMVWDLNPTSAGRNLVCSIQHVLLAASKRSPSLANLRTQIFGIPILSVSEYEGMF